ncbi:nuclear pore complex protein Nup153-like isoform X2 [Pieris napi]|uniref:nuclear pore complex protein Nup153-like isoform X2 n=1 Tax=Pieris napi TaxID=78633 RepID=UPI001FB93607|nr:nuclear pore complex protein Nup153-like isoform X2 [Pieris napi]
MNSREAQESSGKSQAPKRTLAKRISAIIPASITKWFKNLQSPEQSSSEQSSPDSGCLGEPEPKRRRLSEDPNKYLPRTACASTNTDSLYSPRLTQKRNSEDLLNATTIKSPEDAVNRVSFSLKSSFRSEDDPMPKETYVDRNRTPGSPFYPGNTTYGGASNHLSQYTIKKRSTLRNRLNKSRGNNDFKISGPSERIMNVFENYSSPLEEARRISQFVSNENKNNSSTTMSNDTSKHIATKSQELHVPSIATILSIKQKSGLMSSTSTARQLLASQSSATKYSPYGVYKNSDSAKRLDKSTLNPKERRASTSSLPMVSKSNSLTINIESLHNMAFTTSTPTIAKVPNISQSPNNIEDMQIENTSFQCTNAADAHRNNTETDCRVTIDSSNTTIDTSIVMTTEFRNYEEENGTKESRVPNPTNLLQWTCEDCWVKNDMSISNCVCCAGKKPINKNDNSKTARPAEAIPPNHDSLLNNNITNATLNRKQAGFSKSRDENWECIVCLVRNDKHNSKCVCCDAERPGTKKSETTFNFGVPGTTQFKFGINLANTTQQPTKETEPTKNNEAPKQFSFGLPPTRSVGDGLEKSNDSISNKSPQEEQRSILEEERVDDQQVFVLKSPIPVNTVQPVEKPKQNSTNLPLRNAGQNTANFDMLSPIVESLNENSDPNTTSNTQNVSASQNSTIQQNESTTNTGTFVPPSTTSVPPSVTSVPESNLFECNLNSFPPESSLKISSAPMFILGSSNNQSINHFAPMKNMSIQFGNKINSTNVLNFGGPLGKCVSPTIDSHGNINSASDTINRNIILSGSGSQTFQHSNEGPSSINTDNSNLFYNVQSQPRQPGGLFRSTPQTENSSWVSSETNLCSAPQGIPTNRRNQAPSLFTFGGMSSDTNSMNNVTTAFRKNAQMPSPSPAFGMPSANANNSFNLVSTFDNQAKSISNINSTPGAGGLFGQTSQLFAETSHQMGLQPSFNFSAGQTTPNVFNFSQSGVRSMSGTSLPQFQVGSSSAPGQARRIRKAVRRTTPR